MYKSDIIGARVHTEAMLGELEREYEAAKEAYEAAEKYFNEARETRNRARTAYEAARQAQDSLDVVFDIYKGNKEV